MGSVPRAPGFVKPMLGAILRTGSSPDRPMTRPPAENPTGTAHTIDLGQLDDATSSTLGGGEREPIGDAGGVGRRYEILEKIGEGAMAVVHRAVDLELRRTVAFKVLKPSRSRSSERRLRNEVALTARLDHPGLVPVHGAEILDDGRFGYAMKLVTGQTLRLVLEEAGEQYRRQGQADHRHDLEARLQVFLKVAEALAYAHSRGVIHRDLKPDNIMLGAFGEVYLMDWGIARIEAQPTPAGEESPTEPEGSDGTQAGQVFGTPAYMAPEQAWGQVDRIDRRTDVFAMGLLLWEILLLRRAYDAAGHKAQLQQAREARLPSPSPAPGCPPAPEDLLAVARRAAAARPEDRYPDVRAIIAEVERYQRGEPTEALPDTRWRAIRRAILGRPALLPGLFAGALLLGLLGMGATWALQQARLYDQELRAQHHQVGMGAHQREVARRGQRIEARFLWVEGLLGELAAAAEYAWSRGQPVQLPAWSASDYREGRGPDGLLRSPGYGREISLAHAVYTVAPDTPEERWRPDLDRAQGLRELIFELLLRQPPDEDRDVEPLPAAGARRLIAGQSPLVWAYVALEDSGLMYMAPGAAGWDERYDPRTRPWYRVNSGRDGNVWGQPYVDLMGQGRLLSATRRLRRPDGGTLGVAGLDLRFEQVIERFVAADELPGFRTAWLVDREGRVMVESTARDDAFVIPATEAFDPGLDFGLIRHPEIREAAARGQSGQLERMDGLTPVLISWTALPSLGWLYGVEVEQSSWMRASVERQGPAGAPGAPP